MKKPPTAETDSCPRIDEIAALIDGRLLGREHEAFTEHLGECETCYELFVETARFQKEERPASEGRLIPHPTVFSRRSAWTAGLAMAASILIAGVFLLPRLTGGLDETLPAGEVVALLLDDASAQELASSAYSGADWPRTRGSFVGSSPEQLSFRLGVRMVDLGASTEVGEARLPEECLVETIEMARSLPDPEEFLASSEGLLEHLMRGEPLDAVSEEIAELDRLLMEAANDPLYTLGKWTEAGLLASRTGNTDLLTERSFRRFLERVDTEVVPETLNVLLAEAGDQLDARPLDMTTLEQTFEGIAAQGGSL